jgi:hypothetical protein
MAALCRLGLLGRLRLGQPATPAHRRHQENAADMHQDSPQPLHITIIRRTLAIRQVLPVYDDRAPHAKAQWRQEENKAIALRAFAPLREIWEV